MKRTTSLKTIVALAVTSLVFSSCGGNNLSGAGKRALAKGPLPDLNVTGDILHLPSNSSGETLDPQTAIYSNSFELIGCMIDGLMTPASDGSVQYAIAKEEIISDDGLLYTFKLRDDAYWSNGDPVTAHDFVYAWRRAVDPKTGSDYAFLLTDIAKIKNGIAVQTGVMDIEQLGVRAVDDYTFQVELTVPVPFFNQLLFFCTFYPANQKFVESCEGNYGTSVDTVLCNGAFILTEWNEDNSYKLVKNTAYYNADNVKLGGIEYKVYESVAARVEAYNAGELDYTVINKTYIKDWKDKPDYRLIDTGFLHYITFNENDALLSNKNLRLAITLGCDRDWLINERLNNGSKPAYACVPPGFAIDSSGNDFTKSGVEFPEYCSYNPQKAKEYYELARKELGVKNITIKFLAVENSTTASLAKLIFEKEAELFPGFTVEFDYVQKSAEQRKRMSKGDFQLGFTNWGPDYADPLTYLSMWQLGNSQNVENYYDPKYESILAECSEGELCTKPAERLQALKEAEIMIMENAVIMPIYTQCDAILLKPNVKNLDFHAMALNKVFKNTSK